MNEIRKGLDSFQLKIVALLFMTFDHVAYFLSGMISIPWWFHLIGRMSAPIFIFICANGFLHTRNRFGYMKRLYLWSVIMEVGNYIANRWFPHPDGAQVINNIFATMFYIVFFLFFIDKLIKGCKEKNKKQIVIGAAALVIPFVLSWAVFNYVLTEAFFQVPNALIWINVIHTLVPLPLLVEGSIFWILLGVGFYYCLSHKKALSIFYGLVSAFFLFTALPEGFTFENMFLLNNQWFMIFSLPLLLMYNHKKGKGMKYFFYLYYPLHIYLLLGLAHLLA